VANFGVFGVLLEFSMLMSTMLQ